MDIAPISASVSAVVAQVASGEAGASVRDSKLANAATASPESTTAKQTQAAASKEQVTAALESVKAYIEPINDALEFSLNEDTQQIVVKIVDRDTKEVIRQMPSEEMIAIAKALDSLKGLFVKQSA